MRSLLNLKALVGISSRLRLSHLNGYSYMLSLLVSTTSCCCKCSAALSGCIPNGKNHYCAQNGKFYFQIENLGWILESNNPWRSDRHARAAQDKSTMFQLVTGFHLQSLAFYALMMAPTSTYISVYLILLLMREQLRLLQFYRIGSLETLNII